MLTILWDNDGVLVDTEGMYFHACKEVLGSEPVYQSLVRIWISTIYGQETLSRATII